MTSSSPGRPRSAAMSSRLPPELGAPALAGARPYGTERKLAEAAPALACRSFACRCAPVGEAAMMANRAEPRWRRSPGASVFQEDHGQLSRQLYGRDVLALGPAPRWSRASRRAAPGSSALSRRRGSERRACSAISGHQASTPAMPEQRPGSTSAGVRGRVCPCRAARSPREGRPAAASARSGRRRS
jgi:hypothetical protein